MAGSFGCLSIYGTKGSYSTQCNNAFHMFKNQLNAFVDYLKTGQEEVNFSETVELIKLIIAGIKSREANGLEILL